MLSTFLFQLRRIIKKCFKTTAIHIGEYTITFSHKKCKGALGLIMSQFLQLFSLSAEYDSSKWLKGVACIQTFLAEGPHRISVIEGGLMDLRSHLVSHAIHMVLQYFYDPLANKICIQFDQIQLKSNYVVLCFIIFILE